MKYTPARKGTWADGNAVPMKVDAMCFYQYRLYAFVSGEWLQCYPDNGAMQWEHVTLKDLHNKLCEACGVGELWHFDTDYSGVGKGIGG